MPDDNAMLLRTTPNKPWKNWHETVSGPVSRIDVITKPEDDKSYSAPTIKRCTAQIQRSIKDALESGLEYRAIGRTWSLSDIARTAGAMIDIAQLNGKHKVHDIQIDPAYLGDNFKRRGLCMVQAGIYISELNRWLERPEQMLSLRTSGAANGQTLAGATQTGTHGSVLDFGAMHDQIVALHLITGPDSEVWLERESYPVIKEAIVNSYGPPLIRNDGLFNAAVLGLGSFGIIHNIVIEVRSRVMLDAYNFNMDRANNGLILDPEMRHRIATLDFSTASRLDPPGRNGKPYFYQPIISPNTKPPQVLMTHMYERNDIPNYTPDYSIQEASWGPGYDFISIAGQVLDVADFLVPVFSKLVQRSMFQTGKHTGTWGELFGYKTQRTKVASGTVAVDLPNALAAIDALLELNDDIGPVPLVFGCRYVKKSPALLAFNRWETTLVVSIDGVYNSDSVKFLEAIPAKMDQAGIEFTQHWGKTNGYDAQRVRAAFGNANVDKWKLARSQLLPDPAVRAMFENDLIRRCGLDS